MPAEPAASLLHKVRSLLAKAESTEFADEAEALTAKAQELMDRHAIDHAMLAASDPAGGAGLGSGPSARKLVVDPPYAKQRFQLLHEVAAANRCRVVFDPHASVASIVGFAEDQDRVEVLYTSLLVQATSAMLTAGTSSRTRSRSFRHSFLVAFAARVGQRLAATAASVVADARATYGDGLLPVLADRADKVDAAVQSEFPHLRHMRITARDPHGVHAGDTAARRADLGAGRVGGDGRRRLAR